MPECAIPQLSDLHIEAIGGVAGDMLLAALLDLGGDRAALIEAYDSIVHLPNEMPIVLSTTEVRLVDPTRGAAPTHIRALQVHAHPASTETSEANPHTHHRHLKDVIALIDGCYADENAKNAAKQTFFILCEAEAIAHNTTPQAVHLHEVGELDSVMDVLGFHILHISLGTPKLSCTPLPSGEGAVMTSHGELACPVPAVRAIANAYHVPLRKAALRGETITPTGIALIATADFEKNSRDKTACFQGVGAGSKRFSTVPNVVRAYGWT